MGAWESKPRFVKRGARRLAEQEQSRVSIRAYCREHGLGEHSFYAWRQRLRSDGAVKFALVESKPVSEPPKLLELVLSGGATLRVPCEEAALGLLLRVLRTEP